jgi:2',3'-cyclic-nucleotide 2'-phosphodiesterase (5'-nucleotidase family)
LSGLQLREIVEQGLRTERGLGLLQISGLRATFDPKRLSGKRLVSLEVGGQPVEETSVYRVATNSFLAQGGDNFRTFIGTMTNDTGKVLSEVVMDYMKEVGEVDAPQLGRWARASATLED